ncbi:SPOR domain-containing protein [Anaeromicropila herbilytica]|uniref:SPOR domain-containing protein n=1 Tax=Anaeromicropila herbilytica TaxID=2785025 RepID=A0A7R7EIP2_9FIRM|nr:SPOR domain-containing protein [Anaeromicropila herbilytica]BCN29502.1 hypothetical protein bsdtb5_07970 [Anaeromicropila herbilytica]
MDVHEKVVISENQLITVYKVQVGLYRSFTNAMNVLSSFVEKGYSGSIIPYQNFYAVQLGSFDELDDAVAFEQELRSAGYDTMIVKVEK